MKMKFALVALAVVSMLAFQTPAGAGMIATPKADAEETHQAALFALPQATLDALSQATVHAGHSGLAALAILCGTVVIIVVAITVAVLVTRQYRYAVPVQPVCDPVK